MTSKAQTYSQTSNSQTGRIDGRLSQAILWVTLGSLFMIPLLFSYFDIVSVYGELRRNLLHFAAGIIATMWLWEVVIVWYQDEGKKKKTVSWDLVDWARSNVARWTVVAVVVFAFTHILSTLLSPIPLISLMGGDDARSGYNLYDSLSLTILLVSLAFRFKTERHLMLFAYVLVVSGTVAAAYGIAQHFGWDPIGGNEGRTRVISSFGNTLNFGAYMVMSIPATMALWHLRTKRPPMWMTAIVLALGLQLAGLWFTGGRGPIVGAAAGIGIYFLVATYLLPRKEVIRVAAASLLAATVAAILVALPSPQGDIGLDRVLSIGEQITGESTTSTDIEGGLTGRFSIWKSTLKLATTWDMPIEEPTLNSALRPAFGIGPEMFINSFPFVSAPQTDLALVDHAHNYALKTLIELGYIGLIILTAISALIILTGYRSVLMIKSSVNRTDKSAILALAILPPLFGKLVEAQTGVPRVSDMAMMFALVGAVIAIHEMVRSKSPSIKNSVSGNSLRSSATTVTTSRPMFVGSMLVTAIVVSALFATLFIGWDVRRISASRHLANTHDNPDRAVVTRGWIDAQATVPERDSFTLNLAQLYIQAAEREKQLGNEQLAIDGILSARDILLEYAKFDPFRLDAQIGLGLTATRMTEWGYTDYAQEMSDRYFLIVQRYPSFPSLIGTAATVMVSVGNHDIAIDFADRAIATEATTKPWPKAWYAKGRALYELGREDEAIVVLNTAIEKDPASDGAILAHQVLADLYESRGDTENSELHDGLGNRTLNGS